MSKPDPAYKVASLTGDLLLEAAVEGNFDGDIVFRTGGAERARIKSDGSGTGWPNVLGGSTPLLVTASGDTTGATDGVAIQAAIDQASANAIAGTGSSEVVVDGACYSTLRVIPGQTAVAAMCWMRSNVKLRFLPGASLKLPNSATLPAPATQGHGVSVIAPYNATIGLVKENIRIEGLVLDGNAANQSGVVLLHGLFTGNTHNAWNVNCIVKNVYGTASSGAGETFHYEANNSYLVHYVHCEADGSGSANTATGFSSDNSFGVFWDECISHHMGFGSGFTDWQSAGMFYTNCDAFLCINAAGFNSERTEGVHYGNCRSGGRSPNPTNAGDPPFPWWATNQTPLGNSVGYQIQGASSVVAEGCSGTYNTNVGILVKNNTAGSAGTANSDNITFVGGDFTNNTNGPYSITASQTNVNLGPFRSNTGNADYLSFISGGSPVWEIRAAGGNGLRFLTDTTASTNLAFRFQTLAKGTVVSIDGFGQLITVGGVKRGKAALTYSASITPDASAGDYQTLTVTNGTAFTINAPTNPPDSSHTQTLTIEILNSSGGAMGVVTWNAAFVFQVGAFVNPASTKKRVVQFEWSGTAWIQVSPVGADF